jgi:hypothetical protein
VTIDTIDTCLSCLWKPPQLHATHGCLSFQALQNLFEVNSAIFQKKDVAPFNCKTCSYIRCT